MLSRRVVGDENQPPRGAKVTVAATKRAVSKGPATVSAAVVQAGQLKRKLAGKGARPDAAAPPEKRDRKDADFAKAKDKSLSLALCARIKEAQALQGAGLIEEARAVYTDMVSESELPEAKGKAVYWVARAKFEEDGNNVEECVKLFESGLRTIGAGDGWEQRTLVQAFNNFVSRLGLSHINVDAVLAALCPPPEAVAPDIVAPSVPAPAPRDDAEAVIEAQLAQARAQSAGPASPAAAAEEEEEAAVPRLANPLSVRTQFLLEATPMGLRSPAVRVATLTITPQDSPRAHTPALRSPAVRVPLSLISPASPASPALFSPVHVTPRSAGLKSPAMRVLRSRGVFASPAVRVPVPPAASPSPSAASPAPPASPAVASPVPAEVTSPVQESPAAPPIATVVVSPVAAVTPLVSAPTPAPSPLAATPEDCTPDAAPTPTAAATPAFSMGATPCGDIDMDSPAQEEEEEEGKGKKARKLPCSVRFMLEEAGEDMGPHTGSFLALEEVRLKPAYANRLGAPYAITPVRRSYRTSECDDAIVGGPEVFAFPSAAADDDAQPSIPALAAQAGIAFKHNKAVDVRVASEGGPVIATLAPLPAACLPPPPPSCVKGRPPIGVVPLGLGLGLGCTPRRRGAAGAMSMLACGLPPMSPTPGKLLTELRATAGRTASPSLAEQEEEADTEAASDDVVQQLLFGDEA